MELMVTSVFLYILISCCLPGQLPGKMLVIPGQFPVKGNLRNRIANCDSLLSQHRQMFPEAPNNNGGQRLHKGCRLCARSSATALQDIAETSALFLSGCIWWMHPGLYKVRVYQTHTAFARDFTVNGGLILRTTCKDFAPCKTDF